MLLWVPYSATYRWGRTSWTTASAGYDWVFSEPKLTVCKFAIEEQVMMTFTYDFDNTACQIKLDGRRLALTLAAAILGAAFIQIMLGILYRASLAKAQTRGDIPDIKNAYRSRISALGQELLLIEPKLPIGEGDLSESTPLVINASKDYVGIEHTIIKILNNQLAELDATFVGQGLIVKNGAYIDALTYRYTNKVGGANPNDKTYHFDITTGIHEARRLRENKWWRFWE